MNTSQDGVRPGREHHVTSDISSPAALEAVGLGRRYRRGWALRDCSFRLPAGRVCALVGPNGAGKTTLLSLAADLLEPSAGSIRLFGNAPRSGAARQSTAFLGQEKALYPRFRVDETLRLGRELNPSWHQETAERIIAEGHVPLNARIGALSGGQRTRVAFALALGKRPQLMLLDEPMADLDPLVRREMTSTLMGQAREHGSTVVMSSHLVSELEDVCDYLVLINNGIVRLAGEVDTVIDSHRLLITPAGSPGQGPSPAGHLTIETITTRGESATLVRPQGPLPDGPQVRVPTLEELLLAYLRTPDAPPLITPSAQPSAVAHEVAA
ncbi:ABC transporter ATP-binding protein [Streptomyces sp. 150FB]|uniref:ABC transporter ATP-binding protein n=1 Tax=Streptomyces sp. 150FB TaxID=1576605 RepID=UPI00099DE598|nr:ABC transporter ATP-binding protein [Streptomyces sp. 150FB]